MSAWVFFRAGKRLVRAKGPPEKYLRSGLVAVETQKGTIYANPDARELVLQLYGAPSVTPRQVQGLPLQPLPPPRPKPRPLKRISANKLIYQVDKQVLYATRSVVEAANLGLRATKAFVTLTLDEEHPMRLTGPNHKENLYRVKPAWTNEFEPPNGYHHILGQLNRGISNGVATNPGALKYFSHADCHRNSQTVMGSNSVGSVIDTERPVVFPGGARTVLVPPTKAEAKNEAGLVDSHANRGVYAFFAKVLPDFAGPLERSSHGDAFEAEIDTMREMGRLGFCAATVSKGWTVYSSLLANEEVAELLARSFGINAYVTPAVGDGLTQVNNENERKNAPTGVDLWNFHWAGVIMTDGASYVTLENLSVENDETLNTDWYFTLYDVGAKSFHSENASGSNPHVGKTPLTLGFVNVPDAIPQLLSVQGMQGTFTCSQCRGSFPSKMKLRQHGMQTGHNTTTE